MRVDSRGFLPFQNLPTATTRFFFINCQKKKITGGWKEEKSRVGRNSKRWLPAVGFLGFVSDWATLLLNTKATTTTPMPMLRVRSLRRAYKKGDFWRGRGGLFDGKMAFFRHVFQCTARLLPDCRALQSCKLWQMCRVSNSELLHKHCINS